jgi:ABC-type antimicrobial peptide transport system permease subunit
MILREGLALALVGTGLGLFGAVQAGGVLESLLFEVGPNDPQTLIVTTLFLLGVAAAAAYLPARRATRVDPVEVLRAE